MKYLEKSLARFSGSAALAAFTLGLLATPEANALVAPMCGSGPACPMGFTCETFPGACPAIACLEGEECLPCMPSDEQYCVSGPCSSDADCAPGMGCMVTESTACPEPAPGGGADGCAPDGTCPTPEPVPADARAAAPAECTTETYSQCLPRWQLECEVDADCGAGFTCDAIEQCSCPGSTGVDGTPSSPPNAGDGQDPGAEPRPDGSFPADGDAPIPSEPPIEDPECVCEPSEWKSCMYEATACEDDADCAAGWTCHDNPNGVCWSDADGGMGCEPADPPRLCMPPYSDLYYGGPVSGGGAETGVGVPTRGEDGSGSDNDSSGLSNDGDAPSSSGDGCSIATPAGSRSAAGGLALLGALVALGLGRRRAAQGGGSQR